MTTGISSVFMDNLKKNYIIFWDFINFDNSMQNIQLFVEFQVK